MRRTCSTDFESPAGDCAFAARQRLASTRMTTDCEFTSAILASHYRGTQRIRQYVGTLPLTWQLQVENAPPGVGGKRLPLLLLFDRAADYLLGDDARFLYLRIIPSQM